MKKTIHICDFCGQEKDADQLDFFSYPARPIPNPCPELTLPREFTFIVMLSDERFMQSHELCKECRTKIETALTNHFGEDTLCSIGKRIA